MSKKKIAVVGAGPGGLTAAMLLQSRGYQVEIFEKNDRVGGRNASLTLDGGFTFDVGPTFLMMKFILEEVFELTGRDLHDYVELESIDPLYRLVYGDGTVFVPSRDRAAMRAEIERVFSPKEYRGYERFMAYNRTKFDRLVPCLQLPYAKLTDFVRPTLARALPYLDVHQSLHRHLGRFFADERLKLAFTFQAKYIGMSPWRAPGLFSIISYIEHSGGIYHPIGGLNQISVAMSRVFSEEGGRLHLSTPVDKVIVRGGRAVGLRLASGEEVSADHVVLNADFGHAMTHLIEPEHLRRWTPRKLETKSFSCSTYMLYLALDKLYDIPHHSIIFASDYAQNVREIAETHELSEEPSIYVQNASVTDPTLAPAGRSTIYILVPVANSRSGIDWGEVGGRYRDKVLEILERRGGLPDLRQHILAERQITPADWEQQRDVYRGATFNLGHGLDQMLYFRPHNAFEEIDHLYLVGGGTHPGSGLPTIYESGRISAGLILKRDAWL